MRSPALALAVFTIACGSSTEKESAPAPPPTVDLGERGAVGSAHDQAPPPPQKKKPVDSKPLPPLAKDPGGATGKAVWATGFGGLGTESPRGIVVAPNGDIYIAGIFDGEMVVGDQKFKATGDVTKTDAFVMKLGADGKIGWTKTYGAKRDDTANGIAIRGDTIVVVGNFLDELQIGKFPAHKAVGSDDLYVAAFDTSGDVKWLWTAGGVDSDGANAVAATPDGGWVVGGSFSDSIEVPGRTLKSKGGTDAILVKLGPGGDLEWVKQFGGRGNDTISHLAVDGQGNIIVQGQFKGISDWGGTPLKAGGGSDLDVVLAKYDLNGDHLWSQRFGDALNDVAGGVTVDPSGFITMVGSFDRRVSFGPGDDHTSLGESDAFVARFAPDGKLAWAHTYGAEREDIAFGVAADGAGNVVASGYFQNLIDFGKGAATHSHGNKDVFVVKFDANGNVVWWQTFGDHDHDQGRAVAMDDKGNAYVTGLYRFTLSVGPTPLESTRAEGDRIPKPDVFVVKLER
jgi:hypothetical protein